MTPKTLLITGGAGFIGSCFLRYMHQTYPDVILHNLDALTYAGRLENVAELAQSSRYQFHHGRIEDKAFVKTVFETVKPDAVVHFAAESHVDRSILDSTPFVTTNVLGTQVLLDAAKHSGIQRFVHVSTDEVYGTLGETGLFTETTPLAPNSPYSASKASSDLLVRAYHETHGLPTLITRCSNNYGPYQFPEKLIPVLIRKALANEPLPIYGNGKNVRDWLYVEDHCKAIDLVLKQGQIGEVYNVGGNAETDNLSMAHLILSILKKPTSLISFVEDRLGHDFRYAIDFSKLNRELGWTPSVSLETGLANTVQWYLDHPHFLT
ncbi:MAG: dTDP-glucose 4,6-dehydratase [Candidatus Margulisiibacteriota bacterium]